MAGDEPGYCVLRGYPMQGSGGKNNAMPGIEPPFPPSSLKRFFGLGRMGLAHLCNQFGIAVEEIERRQVSRRGPADLLKDMVAELAAKDDDVIENEVHRVSTGVMMTGAVAF